MLATDTFAAQSADSTAASVTIEGLVKSFGGVVVIPAFAVGRAQALLLHLHRLRRDGRIPDVPVYLNSPMAVDASILYRHRPDEHRIDAAELAGMYRDVRLVRDVDDSKLLNLRGGPMIIVAASGMLTGGRVLHHLAAYGDDPRNAIILAGYQAGGTRGAALQRGERTIRMFGREHPIRARVITLSVWDCSVESRACSGVRPG